MEKVKLIKGSMNITAENKAMVETLKKLGYKLGNGEIDYELEALKAEADSLGIQYHHKAGANTIKELIAKHKNQ